MLNRALESIAAQNNMELAQLQEALMLQGITYDAFREQIRRQLLIQQIRQRQVANQVEVRDDEVDRLLAQLDQQDTNHEYRLSHILIEVPEAASPEALNAARQQAEALAQRLRSGEDFAALATAHSNSATGLQGGDLGWRTAARVPSLFTEQVAAMDPGDISDPIRSASGYHILELADQRSGGERHIVTQYRARHILIKPTAVLGAAQVRERLERIKTRLENGDDFGELAKAHSEDTGSALNGGELDWAAADSYVPRFADPDHRRPECHFRTLRKRLRMAHPASPGDPHRRPDRRSHPRPGP